MWSYIKYSFPWMPMAFMSSFWLFRFFIKLNPLYGSQFMNWLGTYGLGTEIWFFFDSRALATSAFEYAI